MSNWLYCQTSIPLRDGQPPSGIASNYFFHLYDTYKRRRVTHPRRRAASLRARKRIEEEFGWIKTVAGLGRTKLRGLEKVDWAFTFAAAAYNLIRLPRLFACEAG